MKTYSRGQVAKLLGVDPRKVEGWVARGVLRAEGIGEGTGSPYRFAFPDIVRAAILREAQESLGTRFVRPGFLSKLLHEQVSNWRIDQERRRIESVRATPPRPHRRPSFPRGEPDDLILHVYRKMARRGDGSVHRTNEMEVEAMQRRDELVLPGGYAVLRLEVGPIVRNILYRMARLDLETVK